MDGGQSSTAGCPAAGRKLLSKNCVARSRLEAGNQKNPGLSVKEESSHSPEENNFHRKKDSCVSWKRCCLLQALSVAAAPGPFPSLPNLPILKQPPHHPIQRARKTLKFNVRRV